MAEKDVRDAEQVATSENSLLANDGGTELKILQKINDLYQKRIDEVERVEGDLEEPSEQVLALKLENKILREWNQKSQETIQQLCTEMTETESLLGEKYEQMLKNMEKVPRMIEIEQEKLLKEINELKSRPSDEIVGDSQLVTLKRKLEEVTEERDSLKEETQKLAKVINSIQEGDSLVNSRTQRLEQENADLKARIAELESQSKRSSLSLLDKIDFNSSDGSAIDGCQLEILPLQTESSTTLLPETSETEDIWSNFLKKVENSLKIDPEEFQTVDSVDKLWKIIESNTENAVKSSSNSSNDAEIQVDVPQQLGTVVQTITETANSVVALLETIESHNTDLPIDEIRALLTDFDALLASIKSSAETKIKTKFTKTGDVEITGFVDIPETKFKEFVEKFQTHEKSVNAKITEKNKNDMHAFRRGLASLVPQIEHLRDQIQDKNYYQKENKALLKRIETLEKKIVSLQGTITKTFNSLASSDMLEEKKRTELQQAFKMNDMIGLTLAIQSIGVGMRNEIFAASMESEKSREEVRMMKKKLEDMEKKQEELIKNPVVTEKETKEMEKMMGMQKIAEEESRQMKKYIASVRLELIHLLTETRNQHSSDGTDSSITSDYDTVSLAGLMNDLKREIIMKDEVLKSRQVTVDNLEMCLAEMKRHLDRIEKENHTLTKTNSELSKQLSVVEKEKQEIAEKKEEFDKLVTDNQQELASLKQAKEQLEFEHANQTQTIQHLRRVLEETKRNGNATMRF
ncbi:optineurin-like isoform X2 [Culicoides brevitarsis]|uniref:optineurin-like isoform X2 n=1 Tax=Culicoides brevitarsis TaxID=469753 RepID=UPI00307B3C5B